MYHDIRPARRTQRRRHTLLRIKSRITPEAVTIALLLAIIMVFYNL